MPKRSNVTTASKLLLSVLGLLLPCLTLAEGNIRLLNCETLRLCDSAGNCQPQTDAFKFRLEPVSLDEDGAGTYQLTYGDVKTTMQALTQAGPFYWSSDTERNTLMASSETAFVWHRLRLGAVVDADVRFMRCEFSQ